MAKSDGSVVIDTLLDTKGFNSGALSMKGQFAKVALDISSLATNMAASIAKVGAVAIVAFGAASTTIIKQSVEAYAEYEQLIGGVETLFKDSADKVSAAAENAFYTVGMSANEYMETVTSFSASLISSLGGDTQKAAIAADKALVSMADNANKMGSSLESVQTAFLGFSKQQYQLLDNLKLGYGGTKTEMERLLKDAEAFSGVKYDINNLADVYEAVNQIQIKLGIAGTTAKEAEKTIAGAANMTKAAWKNVLTAMSGGGDMNKAINNLVFSVTKLFENVTPIVEKAIVGLGDLVAKSAPAFVETVAAALIRATPGLVKAVYQMIIGVAKGIYNGIVSLLSGATTEIEKQLNDTGDVADNYNEAADAAANLAEETENSADAAKKAVAGFDELNVLSSGSKETEEAVDLSTITSAAAVSVPVEVSITDNATGKLAEIAGKIKGIFEQLINDIKTKYSPSISSWGGAFTEVGVKVSGTLDRLKNTMTGITQESFVPFASYMVNDFTPSITNSFSTGFANLFADVLPLLIDNWVFYFEQKTLFMVEVLGTLKLALEDVKTMFSDMSMTMSTEWEKNGDGLIEKFTIFRDTFSAIMWDLYDGIVKPVLDYIGATFGDLYYSKLQPAFNEAISSIMNIANNLLILWDQVLRPAISWVIQQAKPSIMSALTAIVDFIKITIEFTVDNVRALWKSLDGLLEFFVGVFTLDFKKAISGLIKFYEGLLDGLKSALYTVINLVIWALNTMIAQLYNGIAAAINAIGTSGIVGVIGKLIGKELSFTMPTQAPKIPYLAKGAVIPPNAPFVAMLGDQKHGTNIEAPLDTIKQAVAEVLSSMSTNGETEVTINFTGDLAQLARVLKPAIDTETRRKGGSLIKGATV